MLNIIIRLPNNTKRIYYLKVEIQKYQKHPGIDPLICIRRMAFILKNEKDKNICFNHTYYCNRFSYLDSTITCSAIILRKNTIHQAALISLFSFCRRKPMSIYIPPRI